MPVVTSASPSSRDAGEDLHLVGLAPLGDETRLAGTALVEFALDVVAREADAGRAAVDHAAERGPVALAPGRDPKKVPEGVVRHGMAPADAGWLLLLAFLPVVKLRAGGLQETVTRKLSGEAARRHRTDTRSG